MCRRTLLTLLVVLNILSSCMMLNYPLVDMKNFVHSLFFQAIAIACCFKDEGPILVVCPAVLRYSWAEELEHWLPLLPKDIHLGNF